MAEPWYARRRRAASTRGSRRGTPRNSPRWAAAPARGSIARLRRAPAAGLGCKEHAGCCSPRQGRQARVGGTSRKEPAGHRPFWRLRNRGRGTSARSTHEFPPQPSSASDRAEELADDNGGPRSPRQDRRRRNGRQGAETPPGVGLPRSRRRPARGGRKSWPPPHSGRPRRLHLAAAPAPPHSAAAVSAHLPSPPLGLEPLAPHLGRARLRSSRAFLLSLSTADSRDNSSAIQVWSARQTAAPPLGPLPPRYRCVSSP